MFLEELCFRLPYNKTTIFKDNELITAGIIEIKDIFPQKPNGSYAEVGITWGYSEKQEFEVSTINDFNISLLKIEIGRYSVFEDVSLVIDSISYQDKEIDIEIEDSGMDRYNFGIELYDQEGEGNFKCVFKAYDNQFEDDTYLGKGIRDWIDNQKD